MKYKIFQKNVDNSFNFAAKLTLMEFNKYKQIAKIIRGLSIDMVESANSGHPGLPLGMADITALLWGKYLKHNPKNPNWFNRDRFVLSGGHGSALLYSILHLSGYDLSLDELKNFRQWGSKTPGHPEYHHTPGVETTTGPLGQGIANAVGMAFAEKNLAARFNEANSEVIKHFTYVFAGDGDLQEGISHETCSFAGHNKLNKLILFYDANNITIDGNISLSYTENVEMRFQAYNWNILKINGHNYEEINSAIQNAQTEKNRPTIIISKTTIGFGSPNKAGTSGVHGSPLGSEETKLTKKQLGLPENEQFYIPNDLNNFLEESLQNGKQHEDSWKQLFSTYKQNHPKKADKLNRVMENQIDTGFLDKLPQFPAGESMATRASSGKSLELFFNEIPQLIAGSADLTGSNKTRTKSVKDFSPENPSGRYVYYGVREHAMAAMMNGMTLHGGILPYGGTFFVFTDYMRPAMRMAALMGIQVIYVLTHDSIGLGEDGPTHQPVEHLSALRAIPNLTVIRPADANEVLEAWKFALLKKTAPTALVLTRQNLPTLDRTQYSSAKNLKKGAYSLIEDTDFELIIIATGSELEIALEAKAKLNENGKKIRVVSFPSTEIFDQQSEEYKANILPHSVPKIVIEAGSDMSWYKYLSGSEFRIISMQTFGASAPYKILYEKFGITAENLVKQSLELLS